MGVNVVNGINGDNGINVVNGVNGDNGTMWSMGLMGTKKRGNQWFPLVHYVQYVEAKVIRFLILLWFYFGFE